MQDLYEFLGVPRDADIDTIKHVYRRKAKTLHPDHGGSATDFEVLTLAKRVLTDQHLRDRYDRTGRADLNSEDTRNQQALTIITSLFTNALASVPRIDIIDIIGVMRSNLAEAIRVGNGQLGVSQQKIDRLEQVRDRIFVAAGKPNRIALLIDGQIRIEQAAVERCKEQIVVHERARDILNDYGYKTDQPSTVTLSFFTQAPF